MRRMKKLMLAMGLMGMVVFTHAAESNKINPLAGFDKHVSELTSVQQGQVPDLFTEFDYSITLKATVGPSWARIEVSCTATGTTAEEAYNNASACLTVAMRKMQQAIQ